MTERILIADDEEVFAFALAQALRADGPECDIAPDGDAACKMLSERSYDVLFCDLHLPGRSGLEVLRHVAEVSPQTFTIVVTAHSEFDSALEALRRGAIDYMLKPINHDEALIRVRRLREQREARWEIQVLRRDVQRRYSFQDQIGESAAMQQVFALIRKVAATTSTVLITGKSGTGKELAARAIHYGGVTADRRFVPVNCAAIPDTLLESELFGHAKGAFTGAAGDKPGYFEVAGGGTLFLDEIGEMPLSIQAKLLRAIETRQIVRIGDTVPRAVNLRVIACTNRDLRAMVDEGRFREDLFYRINVVEIRLPSLRERREDIPALARYFIQKYARELNRPVQGLDNDGMRALMSYDWKGNVRELENVIERAVILAEAPVLGVRDLPPMVASGRGTGAETADLREAIQHFERQHIVAQLEKSGGNREAAAALLGIGVSSLYRKMAELGIRQELAERARTSQSGMGTSRS